MFEIPSSLSLAPHLQPLKDEEFENMMASFELKPTIRVAVAFSGGTDSLCLLLQAHRWIQKGNGYLIALNIDHKLRFRSQDELNQITNQLHKLKIQYDILPWNFGPKCQSRIQEKARLARKSLLEAACFRYQVPYILLAHQQDDQLETVLMRLGKDSGPRGLAGMTARYTHNGITWLRPFLTIPRTRLEATLRKDNIQWFEDPANSDPLFARTHARKKCQEMEPQERENLFQKIQSYGQYRRFLEQSVNDLISKIFYLCHQTGYGIIQWNILKNEALEIQRLFLQHVIKLCRGSWGIWKRKIIDRFLFMPFLGDRTLGGCLWHKKGDLVFIYRELKAIQTINNPSTSLIHVWDHRFHIQCKHPLPPQMTLQAIGPSGTSFLKANNHLNSEYFPHQAWVSLPALWDNNRLIEAPFTNLPSQWIMEWKYLKKTPLIELFELPPA